MDKGIENKLELAPHADGDMFNNGAVPNVP